MYNRNQKKQLSIYIIITILFSLLTIFNASEFVVNQSNITLEKNDYININNQSNSSEEFELLDNWDDNFGNPILIEEVDDIVYIATRENTLLILNITEKTNPVYITELYMNISYLISLNVSNNLLYLIDDCGTLLIVDVSDVVNPIIVSYLQLNKDSEMSIFLNKIIYIYHPYDHLNIEYNAISIVNITDPLNPYVEKEFSFNYQDDYYTGIYTNKNNLFFWVEKEIYIYNISDSLNPVYISNFSFELNCDEIFVYENFLYLHCYSNGFFYLIYNISSITLPSFISEIDDIGCYSNYRVSHSELIFLNNTVKTFYDFTNPIYPSLIGSFHGKYHDSDYYQKLVFDNNYIYLIDYYSGLEIYSIISNNAIFVSEFQAGEVSLGVFVNDPFVYVYEKGGFEIFNAKDPHNLEFVSEWSKDRYTIMDLVVEGEIVYVIYGCNLILINVSDPYNPIEICSINLIPILHKGVTLEVNERIVYLFYEFFGFTNEIGFGLITINCSIPEEPILLDVYEKIVLSSTLQSDFYENNYYIEQRHLGIEIYEHYAFCVWGYCEIFNVINPNNITLMKDNFYFSYSYRILTLMMI